MNQNQYESLKKYEKHLRTATYAKYYVGLDTNNINNLIEIHNELYPGQKLNHTACNSCILNMLQKMGKDYFKYQEMENNKKTVATEDKPVKKTRKKKEVNNGESN